jgi:hypothetical protein
VLEEESVYWYEIYQLLHLSRAVLFDGPGAIPLSEIAAYCDLMDIREPAEREDLMTMIRRLDSGYLDLVEARQIRNKAAKGTDGIHS